MYQLFSQTKITGSRHTAARLSASWKAPMLVAPIAEEARGDLAATADLRRPAQPAGDRQVGADDGVGAVVAVLGAGDVHGPALARADPAGPAEQFGEDGVGRRAAGQRVRVTAVGAERVVTGAQHRRRADGDRLVPETEVGGPVDQPLAVQRVGPLLEGAQVGHPRVEVKAVRLRGGGHGARVAAGTCCLV
jgi:hypothetical protein